MASRPGVGWRMVVVAGCVAPTVALAGCWPAGYDLYAPNAPAGTAEAMGKITNYQITQCGISYG